MVLVFLEFENDCKKTWKDAFSKILPKWFKFLMYFFEAFDLNLLTDLSLKI
jgi:hypothetical protein